MRIKGYVCLGTFPQLLKLFCHVLRHFCYLLPSDFRFFCVSVIWVCEFSSDLQIKIYFVFSMSCFVWIVWIVPTIFWDYLFSKVILGVLFSVVVSVLSIVVFFYIVQSFVTYWIIISIVLSLVLVIFHLFSLPHFLSSFRISVWVP